MGSVARWLGGDIPRVSRTFSFRWLSRGEKRELMSDRLSDRYTSPLLNVVLNTRTDDQAGSGIQIL